MAKTKTYKLEFYGDTYKVWLGSSQYTSNGKLAVIMFDDVEEFTDVSVNIHDTYHIPSSDMAFIDTNNNPWLEEFLQKNRIAEPMGVHGFSGFCAYPLYRFDLSKLTPLDD